MIYIYPYNSGSASAKALRDGLPGKMIKRKNSKFSGSPSKQVLNWGCSSLPVEVMKCDVLNQPSAVATCANKLFAFQKLDGGAPIPRWTTDPEVAKSWGCSVVERHSLSGHSGEGIKIKTKYEELEEAPLYVEYIGKEQEYRIHIFGDEVIDVQRKARKLDVPDEEVNWQIRNLAGGFVYVRKGFDVHEHILEAAKKAVDCLYLDFGAVDIIQGVDGNPYVLEVNTAPGLTGTTLEKYIEAVKGAFAECL